MACLAACAGATIAMRDSWRAAPEIGPPLPQLAFWVKLLPFAGWIWATNLLANLTDVADRYLILYFADGDAAAASALVGQYHSSRVVPDLLASVAAMLAGVLLPYNSHDWETGNRDVVSRRINLALKATGLTFTAAGAALLWIAQPLFAWVLEGKYELGREVLPWTLLLCIFFSLSVLALNYMWCAERAGRAVLAMGAGLICNIAFNLVLLPRFGLPGAVIATAAANAVSLACAYWLNHRLGMRLDGGVAAASLAPLALLLGAAPAAMTVIALTVIALRSDWIFNPEDKGEIAKSLRMFWSK
jgi:O-antigen/teichoic acid export membrane protein